MKYLFILIFIIITLPQASFANSYPYKGSALMKKDSKWAGEAHDWLRLCAGKYSKLARETEKEVKRLSSPDYKIYRQAKQSELAKGYTYSTGCKSSGTRVSRDMKNYVEELKIKVDKKLGINKVTKEETKPSLSSKKKIYVTNALLPEICKLLDCWDDFKKAYNEYEKIAFNSSNNFKSFAIAYNKKITNYISAYGWDHKQGTQRRANESAIEGCEQYKDKSDTCHVIFENNLLVSEELIDLLTSPVEKFFCLDRSARWSQSSSCKKTEWQFKQEQYVAGGALKINAKSKDGTNLVFRRFDKGISIDENTEAKELSYVISRPFQVDSGLQYSRMHMCEAIWNKEWSESASYKGETIIPEVYRRVFCSLFNKAEIPLNRDKSKIYCKPKDGGAVYFKDVNSKLIEKYKSLGYPQDGPINYCLLNEVTITKYEYENISGITKISFEDQTLINQELIKAQNYINDLLAYIKTYPSTFDILEITNFMIGNKNILDGSWGDLEKEGFKLFKNYTESSKEFLAFHEQQNDIRNKDALNKITNAKNDLKKLINYFTFYLQDNLTSELAPDILDNIKLARNTLTSIDIGELTNVITQLNNYITSKDLTSNYRKFAATQTETVVTKKETKKEEKKINTTQISSKEDFKKAQSALKKLGFYNGVIDGLFGRVSIKALNAWQEVSNLTLTDSISVDLLEQLESAAKNSNNKVVKEESIVDTKTTQSTTFNPEQRAAQEYLNDFLIFIKSNPTLFDIIEITELISVNKVILDGEWNAIQEKDFAEFKSYTSASEDFLKFHSTQNDQRQKDILNEIAFQNTKLKNIISYFRYFLQNNITSDLAPEVIKNIKFAETSLEGQNLGILNDTNNQLEEFISNQNLNADYTKHIKSLASKDQEKDTIASSSIDAIDLVNFDFIKNADDSDFITLVNLSGQAPNALLNLEGNVVFEKDIAYSCFYQTKEIKNDLKYYLYDKVANQKFLAFDQGFECNQNNLLNYDLIFFEKDALLREEKSYVSSLSAAIGSDQLQLFTTVTKKEYEKDFFQREMFAEQIKDDVLNEARLGFGALIIANDNTTLCTDVDSSLGHMSIMNLLGNEFIRMGYDKSVNDIAFNTAEDTFTNVQRGNCGFIYAGETSLNNLMTAFENSNTSYDVLPIWLSKKQVANEQERQENKEKGLLIDLQKKKEQIEKEKKLEQERLKADGILKAQEQQALRDRNRVVVEAHIELMENEIKLLFNKDTFKDTWLYESYPDLGKLMEKKFKEKWELDQSNVTINDYGLSDYKGRKIATFITDINFRLMNRDLGEYETICMRLAIIADSEFSRWREPEASICKTNDDINLTEEELYEKYKNSFDIYKKRLNFQSAWIVE